MLGRQSTDTDLRDFPRMLRLRAGTVVLAAALAAGTAACGSSPAPDPLKGLAPAVIAAKAVAGTEAAGSFQVTGAGKGAGQTLSFAFTVAAGRGCTGTVTEGSGSFKLIESGSALWVQPDTAFYKAAAGHGALVPASLAGKYLAETAGKSALGSFGSLCRLNPLLTAFKAAAASFREGAATTAGGVRVLPLTSGSAALYVTDTASPELVKISVPGSVLYYFSHYGAPAAISVPSAADVADGIQYGF
jgi:hypothetical protein